MNVRVYVTDLPMPASEVHPIAVVADDRHLPPHPHGLVWRYWITTDTRDTVLKPYRPLIEAGLEQSGFCILIEPIEQLLSPLPLSTMRARSIAASRRTAGQLGEGLALAALSKRDVSK